MTRSVYDVDLDVVMHDGAVLGIDGDAPLTLDVVRVHYAVNHFLVCTENSALIEEGVNQG